MTNDQALMTNKGRIDDVSAEKPFIVQQLGPRTNIGHWCSVIGH
jgi:hypothetical protein